MNPNFMLFYVDHPLASAAFYEKVLGQPPIETSPTFVMFALKSGVMLGLWSKHTVAPPPPTGAHAGSSELAFTVESDEQVERAHQEWLAKGLPISQPPTTLDFGRTFVALDPDGHRLRVFAPGN